MLVGGGSPLSLIPEIKLVSPLNPTRYRLAETGEHKARGSRAQDPYLVAHGIRRQNVRATPEVDLFAPSEHTPLDGGSESWMRRYDDSRWVVPLRSLSNTSGNQTFSTGLDS